jgi:hypothetical protein
VGCGTRPSTLRKLADALGGEPARAIAWQRPAVTMLLEAGKGGGAS